MADMGLTEVQAVIQQTVSDIIQEELKERSILPATCNDMSARVGPGMDQLKVPKGGSFTTESKTENTDLTAQVIDYSTTNLDLDQHKSILVRLEDRALIQGDNFGMVEDIVRRMGSEMALDVDRYLYDQLKLASASAPDHRIAYANNPTDTIAKADILEARRLLNEQFAPMSDRFLLVNPAQEKSMLSIAEFVEADKYGDARGLQNGELGRIYGFTVIVSTVAEDTGSIAYHRGAVSYAFQRQVQFETDRNLAATATEYLMQSLYGAVQMQDGKHQVLIGSAT